MSMNLDSHVFAKMLFLLSKTSIILICECAIHRHGGFSQLEEKKKKRQNVKPQKIVENIDPMAEYHRLAYSRRGHSFRLQHISKLIVFISSQFVKARDKNVCCVC